MPRMSLTIQVEDGCYSLALLLHRFSGEGVGCAGKINPQFASSFLWAYRATRSLFEPFTSNSNNCRQRLR